MQLATAFCTTMFLNMLGDAAVSDTVYGAFSVVAPNPKINW